MVLLQAKPGPNSDRTFGFDSWLTILGFAATASTLLDLSRDDNVLPRDLDGLLLHLSDSGLQVLTHCGLHFHRVNKLCLCSVNHVLSYCI